MRAVLAETGAAGVFFFAEAAFFAAGLLDVLPVAETPFTTPFALDAPFLETPFLETPFLETPFLKLTPFSS